MMRAAVLCLVVALVKASESGEVRCEDEHDVSPPTSWSDWATKLWHVAACGRTIADDLTQLQSKMQGDDKMEWEDIRDRLDEIVEKTSKIIMHSRLLFGPMLTMPVDMRSILCDSVATFSKSIGFATTPGQRHAAILADAKCFSVLVRQAFTYKWMEDNNYSQEEKGQMFMESVYHLMRLQHDGHAFHLAFLKLTGRQDNNQSVRENPDAVKIDTKESILERLIKALKTNP